MIAAINIGIRKLYFSYFVFLSYNLKRSIDTECNATIGYAGWIGCRILQHPYRYTLSLKTTYPGWSFVHKASGLDNPVLFKAAGFKL